MVLELPVEERKCNRCHFASTDLTQCFYSVFREANNYVVRYTPCAKMTRASNPAADAEPEYVYSADLLHKMEPCSRFEASIRAEDSKLAAMRPTDREKRYELMLQTRLLSEV